MNDFRSKHEIFAFRPSSSIHPVHLALNACALDPTASRLAVGGERSVTSAAPAATTQAKLQENYGKLPLNFEANRGQAPHAFDQVVNFTGVAGGGWISRSHRHAAFRQGVVSADCCA
jgi:hypothetical protein